MTVDCMVCGDGFDRELVLDRHMRREHPDLAEQLDAEASRDWFDKLVDGVSLAVHDARTIARV